MLFHIQPREARSSPILTLHTSPGVGTWRGVNRLQRRDHAELAEARDVGGIDRLDMLDAMTAAAFGRGLALAAA